MASRGQRPSEGQPHRVAKKDFSLVGKFSLSHEWQKTSLSFAACKITSKITLYNTRCGSQGIMAKLQVSQEF